MKLLLDTHIFLWFISGDQRLSSTNIDAIRNPANEVFVSAVSIWEATLKHQLGKLPLPGPPGIYLTEQRERHSLSPLPLNETHVTQLNILPPLHRDPFDRMLVCQAIAEGLTIVTVDQAIQAYPVSQMK